MNILSLGQPFFRDYGALSPYRGPHDIRTLSAEPGRARYTFTPGTERLQDVLDRLAPEWRPDLILCWFPENDPPPLGIETSPVPTVAMAGDWNMFHPALVQNLARYDAVLCDKPGTHILANQSVTPHHLFPLYAQDSRYHHPFSVDKDIDIFYGGSLNMAHYGDRGRYLERIARLSDRYSVVLADHVFDEAYGRLMARSRIVFNRSVRGEANLRTFETLAVGSIAFVERENLEIRDWFTDGREIVLYGEDDLEERLHECLAESSKGVTIAHLGHARAAEFAPENRIDALVDWAIHATPSGRRFHRLDPVTQAVHTLLMYATTLRAAYFPLRDKLVSEVVRLAPDQASVWAAAGRAMLYPKAMAVNAKRSHVASQLFEKASRLAPHSAVYTLGAATACEWSGRLEEAEKWLEATLRATTTEGEPFLPGWFDHTTWMRWMRAVAERKAQLSVLHGEAYARLAQMAVSNGQPEKALDLAHHAHDTDPDNDGAIPLAADLLWDSGQRAEAIRLLREHKDAFPFDFGPRLRLLEMLKAMNHHAEADDLQSDLARIAETLNLSQQVTAASRQQP